MAEYRIVVVVDPSKARRGTQQVERGLNQVSDTADRTRRLIARAFAFVGVGAAIRQLVQLADTFTNVQNRIRTVTDGTAQLNAVTQDLFAISNRTRSTFQATAEVYTRTALATRELGLSQRQTLEFTESLNQAVILGGASAQEANAGMIQLSQGLASGALRGDELRSVLEQLPVVADVIAKSMGITRGRLRELGTEGKITAGIILKAFAEAREELADRFAETVPTIGQSFTVLRNKFVEIVGMFDDATDVMATLSRFILLVAGNLDTIARVAGTAAIALGIHFAVKGVGAAISALKALSVAILTNPIGAIATAALLTVSALIAFGDQILVGEGRLANLHDLGLATFEALEAAVDTFLEFFTENFGFIATLAAQVFGDVEASVEGVLRVTARVVDGMVGLFKGAARAIVIAFEDIPAALESIFVRAFNSISRAYTDFVNAIIFGINKLASLTGLELISEMKVFEVTASEGARAIGARMDEAIAQAIREQGSAEAALDDILARAEEIARERLAAEAEATAKADAARAGLGEAGTPRAVGPDPAFLKILDLIKKEGELLKINSREREVQKALLAAEKTLKRDLTVQERGLLDAQLRVNQSLADRRALLDDIRKPQEDYNVQMGALVDLLNRGAITSAEFANKQRELLLEMLSGARDMESGIRRGLLKIGEEFGDVAALAEETLVGAFRKAEDTLVEFVQTGKMDFKSLIDSIMADITRLAVRQAITAPLAKALGLSAAGGTAGGGGGGNIFSMFSNLFNQPPAAPSSGSGFLSGAAGAASLFANLPGFNNGGDIRIGGTGGRDRNTLSVNNKPVARVSRGETISVKPNGKGERPIQLNMNINTLDANSFKRSENQLLRQAGIKLNRELQRSGG